MGAEGGEHGVVRAYLLDERVRDRRRVLRLGDALRGGLVEEAQRLPEDVPLDLVPDIEAVVDGPQALGERRRVEGDGFLRRAAKSAAGGAGTAVEAVDQKSKGAPSRGARTKKLFSRLTSEESLRPSSSSG